MLSLELIEELGRGSSATSWHAQSVQADGASSTYKVKIGHKLSAGSALAREAWATAITMPPFCPALITVGHLELNGSRATELAANDGPSKNSLPFIAFAAREGQPLRAAVEKGESETEQIMHVAHDIAAALNAMHAVGIGHGDVKPDNILIGSGGCTLLDLGLSERLTQQRIDGATPRYLGRGDAELGTTRDRDLLALGITLSEMASPAIAREVEPLAAARALQLKGALGAIVQALLVPHPGARPSAQWVQGRAQLALGTKANPVEDAAQRRVRAAYIQLRQREIPHARECSSDTAPWLAHLVELNKRLLALDPNRRGSSTRGVLGPLDRARRKRWLTRLIGPAAFDWPLPEEQGLTEAEFTDALLSLATKTPPHLWTLAMLQNAFAQKPSLATKLAPPALDQSTAALALALSRIPACEASLEFVEAKPEEMPAPLRMAAADVLRLRGELTRALRLTDELHEASAMRADLLRRSRDFENSELLLRSKLQSNDGDDQSGLRACLARLHYDQGDLSSAKTALSDAPVTSESEVVRGLVAAREGKLTIATKAAERARALAHTPEQRARAAGTIAFVSSGHDTARTRAGFREAALHAAQAGAIREEAQYLTGLASACTDEGDIRHALESASRAAQLFDDALDRPALASRAWLSRAACFALIGASLECQEAADEASQRAQLTNDVRAEGYSHLVVADGHPTGSPEAKCAADRAAERLGYSRSSDLNHDALRAAARLWAHDAAEFRPDELERLDHFAAEPDTLKAAQLEWWTARADRCPLADEALAGTIIEHLVALQSAPAPLPAFGKAMYAGATLAMSLGRLDAHETLEAARARVAQKVELPDTLHSAAKRCAWLAHRAEQTSRLSSEENLDLRRLIHTLSERGSVESMLRRVLDVALVWTGAERGILLVPHDDELRIAAARHLERHDLDGPQLTLSMRLAAQAMQSAETIVAADAMSELGESHQSVHALKLRSILVAPLIARGEAMGVLYLDDRYRSGAFGEHELAMTRTAAPIAALAIADTRAQEHLREALDAADGTSEQLEEKLAREQGKRDLAERQLAELRGQPTRRAFAHIIGQSDAIQSMLAIVDRVGSTDLPVLVRGESGTGKELIARAIAESGARADQAFVSENCGALPDTLLEATLFGHERGAFTGADRQRIGLFEAANGGTLFLDEVGEMSPAMQTRLLRVLEDGIIRPLGTTESRQVDVRVVAATHRDLETMVRDGSFREDLYFRLNVVPVEVPPLRARLEDVGVLAAHFLKKHADARQISLSPAAEIVLSTFDWPGNVRQLENEILRAIILCDDVIDIEHLSISGASQAKSSSLGLDLKAHVARLERRLVRTGLSRTEGNQTQAAKLLGLSRYGLHKMMKRLEIDAKQT